MAVTDVLVDGEYGPEERFRIYLFSNRSSGRGRGHDGLTQLCTCATLDDVGGAIVQQIRDYAEVGKRLSDDGVLGVLDGEERVWIINPFPRSA